MCIRRLNNELKERQVQILAMQEEYVRSIKCLVKCQEELSECKSELIKSLKDRIHATQSEISEIRDESKLKNSVFKDSVNGGETGKEIRCNDILNEEKKQEDTEIFDLVTEEEERGKIDTIGLVNKEVKGKQNDLANEEEKAEDVVTTDVCTEEEKGGKVDTSGFVFKGVKGKKNDLINEVHKKNLQDATILVTSMPKRKKGTLSLSKTQKKVILLLLLMMIRAAGCLIVLGLI